MNELINVLSQDGNLVVSSREVASNFEKEHNDTKKRIRELEKDMGEISHNYFIKEEYKDTMNRTQEEYLLTRDGFSLLVMGFTGQKALQWKLKYIEAFNKMEQHIKSQILESYAIEDPIERAKAWIKEQEEKKLLETTNEQQRQIIGELKPKADYTDTILKNKGLVTITQIAKDYGMSGQAMNKILHDLKIQYYQSKQWLLYRDYHGKGYTHSETINITRSDGRPDISMTTKWTQKGRLFLYDTLKANGILPIIEQEE